MEIQAIKLTEEHIGRHVIYAPGYGDIREPGKIKSFNDIYIFVDYGYNTKGTSLHHLEWEYQEAGGGDE